MHQLSIDHDAKSVSISEHSDFDDAHRALMTYVDRSGLLPAARAEPIHQSATNCVRLADDDDPAHLRRPRITGSGHLEEITGRRLPVACALLHRLRRAALDQRPRLHVATRIRRRSRPPLPHDRADDGPRRSPLHAARRGCAARSRPTGRRRRQPRRPNSPQ